LTAAVLPETLLRCCWWGWFWQFGTRRRAGIRCSACAGVVFVSHCAHFTARHGQLRWGAPLFGIFAGACLLAGCAAQALFDWIGKHKPAFQTAARLVVVG
jgi:hypothetical protein